MPATFKDMQTLLREIVFPRFSCDISDHALDWEGRPKYTDDISQVVTKIMPWSDNQAVKDNVKILQTRLYNTLLKCADSDLSDDVKAALKQASEASSGKVNSASGLGVRICVNFGDICQVCNNNNIDLSKLNLSDAEGLLRDRGISEYALIAPEVTWESRAMGGRVAELVSGLLADENLAKSHKKRFLKCLSKGVMKSDPALNDSVPGGEAALNNELGRSLSVVKSRSSSGWRVLINLKGVAATFDKHKIGAPPAYDATVHARLHHSRRF